MHIFKTYDRVPFGIISEIIDMLNKVWDIFIASFSLAY